MELAVEDDRVVAGVGSNGVLVLSVQLAGLARVDPSTVIRLNSCEPCPVNWSVTIGEPVFGSESAVMPDSTRSLPVSAGGSLNRYQYSPLFERPFVPAPRQLAVAILQETGSVLAGTFSTCVSGGWTPSL